MACELLCFLFFFCSPRPSRCCSRCSFPSRCVRILHGQSFIGWQINSYWHLLIMVSLWASSLLTLLLACSFDSMFHVHNFLFFHTIAHNFKVQYINKDVDTDLFNNHHLGRIMICEFRWCKCFGNFLFVNISVGNSSAKYNFCFDMWCLTKQAWCKMMVSKRSVLCIASKWPLTGDFKKIIWQKTLNPLLNLLHYSKIHYKFTRSFWLQLGYLKIVHI